MFKRKVAYVTDRAGHYKCLGPLTEKKQKKAKKQKKEKKQKGGGWNALVRVE